jgi:L-fuculose-phosphate aldolase
MTLESRLVNLAAAGRKLVEHGLVRGAGGNISLRWQELCYISPSGARLDRLSAADFVTLSIAQQNTWQISRASSEYAMHLACYRARPDAATVLHVHPPNCIALGCAGLSLPAITPDFYLAVGPEAPLLPYITPTTEELAEAVGQAIAASDAVLLANHGLVLVAASTEEAVLHSLVVEEAARIMLLAHAAAGSCSFLTPEHIAQLERTTGRYHRTRQPAQGQDTA